MSTATPHRPRNALALGMVGALGEELLAGLVGGSRYATVHVAVEQWIGSAAARFKPWIPGQGVVVADDAYICITGPETFVPAATPMQRVGPADVARAARTARDCGATRLVLVSPLPALLQMNAASHTLSSAAEVELAELGFETLLVIRPTVDAAHASGVERAGPGIHVLGAAELTAIVEETMPAALPRKVRVR